jgi:hypothetical protein
MLPGHEFIKLYLWFLFCQLEKIKPLEKGIWKAALRFKKRYRETGIIPKEKPAKTGILPYPLGKSPVC